MKRICIAWLLSAIGAPVLAQVAPSANCPPNNLIPNCPNNVIELRKQQEAQRQAQIRAQQEAQRQAQIRAQQEAAQRAAQQRAQQEAAQRAAQQRAQQEAAQRAALQKAQQEAAQRAAAQKAQQESAQRAAQQRAQQEAAQKAAIQRAQQEAAQKAVGQRTQQEAAQRTQQEAAQRAAQQRAQQEAARKAAIQKAQQEAKQAAPRPAAPLQPVAKPLPAQPVPAPQAQPASSAPKVAVQPARIAPAPARALALSPTATVAPAPDRSGYTINQRRADGSNLVVQQTVLPGGTRQVTAYRQMDDPRSRTSTRVYLDGYRVTQAPTYVSRTLPNQATFTQYNTGLRGAVLPGNRPVYKEQYVTVRSSSGVERRTVQRTVYMTPAPGGYVPLKTQVVQVYEVVQVYQRPVYVYRPVRYAPVFFAPFAAPFAAPLVAGPQCVVCPPPVVAYEAPPRYDNSYDLLGDMQLAGPLVDDPLLPARDSAGNVPAGPGLAGLRNEVDDLQRQVDEQARDNSDLQAALTETALQRTSTTTAPADVSRMKVPDRVREVIRKEVRLNVAQHQNGNPLLLSDIVESGFAKIYVFQASAPIDVEDVRTGAPCRLAAGDLAEFHKVPDASSAAAPMSVIASRPGHCEPNQVVHVKLEDLQDMLNAFSQRVEENMKKLNSCLTARGACMRT